MSLRVTVELICRLDWECRPEKKQTKFIELWGAKKKKEKRISYCGSDGTAVTVNIQVHSEWGRGHCQVVDRRTLQQQNGRVVAFVIIRISFYDAQGTATEIHLNLLLKTQ